MLSFLNLNSSREKVLAELTKIGLPNISDFKLFIFGQLHIGSSLVIKGEISMEGSASNNVFLFEIKMV